MWRGRESCVKWEGLGVLGQGKFKEREPPLGFKEPGMGVGGSWCPTLPIF